MRGPSWRGRAGRSTRDSQEPATQRSGPWRAPRDPRGQPGAGSAAGGRNPTRLAEERAGEPWTWVLGSGAAIPSSLTRVGGAPTHPATPRHRLRREGGAAAARGGRGGRRGGRDCEGDAPQRWPGAPPLGGVPYWQLGSAPAPEKERDALTAPGPLSRELPAVRGRSGPPVLQGKRRVSAQGPRS